MKFKLIFNEITKIFNSPYSVYEYLVESVYKCSLKTVDEETHLRAVDVQCWCELANVGDSYEDRDFTVECVYSFNS
jgi:hypothetical protein